MPNFKWIGAVRNHFSEQQTIQNLLSPNAVLNVCYVMDDQGHEQLVTEYMIQQRCLKLIQQCQRVSRRPLAH